jgi:hypothetical protein
MQADPYREYLDKEMTIMGILSAFAVACPAAVLNAVGGTPSPWAEAIGNEGRRLALVGSGLMLLAALLFYKQRSRLAYYYGQVALEQARSNDDLVRNHMIEADSWKTWVPYHGAFAWLIAGGIEYAWALVVSRVSARWQMAVMVLPAVGAAAYHVGAWWLLARSRFRSSDEPVCALFHALRRN